MIIGLDVDGTVVDSITPWLSWYKFRTGHELTEETLEGKTDLASLMTHHSTPVDYWRQGDLYDTMEPLEGVKDFIDRMKDSGHEVVFVSYCFP